MENKGNYIEYAGIKFRNELEELIDSNILLIIFELELEEKIEVGFGGVFEISDFDVENILIYG